MLQRHDCENINSKVCSLNDYRNNKFPHDDSISSEIKKSSEYAEYLKGTTHINKSYAPENRGDNMDWQEKYIEKVDQEVSGIKSEIKDMENKISNRIDSKLEDFRNEMRHLDNQRINDMREIRNSLESTNKHAQNTVLAVAAMVITVIIGIFGIWYSVSSSQAEISKQLQQQNIQIQELKNVQQSK